jgi:hypothetical protein
MLRFDLANENETIRPTSAAMLQSRGHGARLMSAMAIAFSRPQYCTGGDLPGNTNAGILLNEHLTKDGPVVFSLAVEEYSSGLSISPQAASAKKCRGSDEDEANRRAAQ